MIRPLALLGLVACGTALVAQEPQFRAAAHTVSIYASVFDGGGRLVPGLESDAFQILDNGVPQPITVFANDPQPITIIVMLDRSGSMTAHNQLVRDAAEAFVGQLEPGDRARIGTFGDRIAIVPASFATERDELIRVLRADMPEGGPTPLWRATRLAMQDLVPEDGRRVVLMFTDGQDTPTAGQPVTFEAIRAQAERDEVMVYAIGLSEPCGDGVPYAAPPGPPAGGGPIRFQRGRSGGGGPGPMGGIGRGGPLGRPGVPVPGFPPPQPPRVPPIAWPPGDRARRATRACADRGPDPDLRELAAASGGGYFELRGTEDLRATFARVADELHQQYLLAFNAPVLDGRVHQIEVRVRDSSYVARARRTYLAVAAP